MIREGGRAGGREVVRGKKRGTFNSLAQTTRALLVGKIYPVVCLSALVGVWPTPAGSLEFRDSDVLPSVRDVVFKRDAVGFVSRKNDLLGGAIFYFVYDSGNRKMVEIDAKRFQERFPASAPMSAPRQDPTRMYDLIGSTANGVEYNLKLKYCGEGVTDDIRKVIVNNKTVRVRARQECTSVSSVEIINNQLWLGTAYSGEGGYSEAEGVIVQDLSGKSVLARLTSVSGWVARMHVDSFSRNVWVITENGVYEISPRFKILSVNLYYHDFDPSTGEPRLAFSNKATRGNPFSVVSRLLPIEDRKSFYAAVARIPQGDLERFRLYDFFMCCDFEGPKYPETFRPLAPFFIKASMRSDTVFQDVWRQSICRLGGPESKQYCERVR